MNYQQLDKIADFCNPVLILALIALALRELKNGAWPFLLRSGLAVIVTQQLSKYVQKKEIWGAHFPSTHFAVALVLCFSLVVLNRRFWPFAAVYLAGYGALMLAQHYHTPREMMGALFAFPLALAFHFKSKKAQPLAN